MAWDDVAGRAAGGHGDKYVVLQVVLTEKLLGTGSGTSSLTNLQAEINKQKSTSRQQKDTACIQFLPLLQARKAF